MVETLLKAGADRNAVDKEGRAAATWAGYNGNTKIAELLK
jgi:ankyrin repeat protein